MVPVFLSYVPVPYPLGTLIELGSLCFTSLINLRFLRILSPDVSPQPGILPFEW